MSLQPFDPAGVQAKQTELYSLSNQMLAAEANAARSNFLSWMNSHFILSAAQQSYLSVMNFTFLTYLAVNVGMAIEYRLPINLVAPTPTPPPTISKMIELAPQLFPFYNQGSGITCSGSLTITIRY